jgi:glycosyl transferase family 2
MTATPNMEFVVNHAKPKAKVSVILLDWGVRESFHSLKYLNWQSVDREQYELIWIEFYERRPKALHEAVAEAEKAGKPLVDKLIVMNHPRNFIFHKHRMYNLGVVVAEGEICVICDSDAMFTPNFIQRIITAFEEDPHGVIHLDEVRSIDRSFYPFNFPTFDEFLASQCQNWTGRTTKGLDNSRDILHEANYGACLAARREDIIGIGGSDEHLDYLGYICGPYDLTFRLANAGGTERWLTDEYLYHTWHPGESGINIDYHGPSDGRGMASRALNDRANGNVFPGLENGAIRALRETPEISRKEALRLLAAPSDAEWRDVARLGDSVAPPKLVKKAARAFDIYLYGGSWYAIPTQSEAFDPVKAKAGIYTPCYRSDSRRDLDRTIRLAAWIQSTPHFVKVAYRRMLPVVKRLRSLLGFGSNRPFDPNGQTEQLVRESYRRHNIVHFRGMFFGISQSLGAFKPALAQSQAECPYLRGTSIADVMYQIRCEIGLPRILRDAVLGSPPVALAAMTVRGGIRMIARVARLTKHEALLTPAEALERFPNITSDPMTELIESYESVLASQR